MNKLNLARSIIRGAITIGVGKIVGDVIENNSNPTGTRTDKVTRKAGTYAIGGFVAHEIVKFTDGKIDGLLADWRKAKAEVQSNQA